MANLDFLYLQDAPKKLLRVFRKAIKLYSKLFLVKKSVVKIHFFKKWHSTSYSSKSYRPCINIFTAFLFFRSVHCIPFSVPNNLLHSLSCLVRSTWRTETFRTYIKKSEKYREHVQWMSLLQIWWISGIKITNDDF